MKSQGGLEVLDLACRGEILVQDVRLVAEMMAWLSRNPDCIAMKLFRKQELAMLLAMWAMHNAAISVR